MPRVFMSYAHESSAVVQRIAALLTQAGIDVTTDVGEVSTGQNWNTSIGQFVRASDVVVLLYPPESLASSQQFIEIEAALSRDLEKRGAELIPVLAEATEVPPSLRGRAWIDLSGNFVSGVQVLVGQIQALSAVDFSKIGPREFENLVADLLRALDFELEDVRHRVDPEVDIRATYKRVDPFGQLETESWVVDTKLYAHQRVNVPAIRQLAAYVSLARGRTRGLFVTNAHLTSVAKEYLLELEGTRNLSLTVLDGILLRRLLRQFPSIVMRYFGGDAKATV
ncbi:TIR domain-containing protein [Saccharothrix sp. HUAS TT1]|uniref:TIR domain-containing protein n=1 Tax=unclassified Saccharothrix TaxID=2593673 RepID=UPI00345C27BB